MFYFVHKKKRTVKKQYAPFIVAFMRLCDIFIINSILDTKVWEEFYTGNTY